MPSSGARSGTKKADYVPAGTGPADVVELRCGHTVPNNPVIVSPTNARRWWCDECHTLAPKK